MQQGDKIQEILVVEGKDDVEAVKRAVDCECVITHGYGFDETLLERLERLQERCGIIVLTDPDYAGQRIRSRIREYIPQAKHAYLPQSEARRGDDIGVENACADAIRTALKKAHATLDKPRHEFTKAEILEKRLDGCADAKRRRIFICDYLGIGYANAKQFLAHLNAFQISREEFDTAYDALQRAEEQDDV